MIFSTYMKWNIPVIQGKYKLSKRGHRIKMTSREEKIQEFCTITGKYWVKFHRSLNQSLGLIYYFKIEERGSMGRYLGQRPNFVK